MAAMPALRSSLRTHPAASLSLLLLFLVSATQLIRDTRDRVNEMLHGEQYVREPLYIDSFTFEVEGLDPSAEAAGVRKGDRLVSVNGHALEGLADYIGAVRRARFGDRLEVGVRRATPTGQTEKDFSVPLNRFTY